MECRERRMFRTRPTKVFQRVLLDRFNDLLRHRRLRDPRESLRSEEVKGKAVLSLEKMVQAANQVMQTMTTRSPAGTEIEGGKPSSMALLDSGASHAQGQCPFAPLAAIVQRSPEYTGAHVPDALEPGDASGHADLCVRTSWFWLLTIRFLTFVNLGCVRVGQSDNTWVRKDSSKHHDAHRATGLIGMVPGKLDRRRVGSRARLLRRTSTSRRTAL